MNSQKRKKRVVILFGGKSAEHEVSLQSAKSVLGALDKDKYNAILVGIDKTGRWLAQPKEAERLLRTGNSALLKLNEDSENVAVILAGGEKQLIAATGGKSFGPVDIVFPVLHGPFGEDGAVQGLLKLVNVPFVGAGVLGSAVGMDKDVAKRLLRDAGIPVAKFITVAKSSKQPQYSSVVNELGTPFFVKPDNSGSSVGVHKVKNEAQFKEALADALSYDNKVLLEEFIKGRELECSVLGNDNPIASLPGEVIPRHEFYSYEAKYIDENGAILEIPAKLPRDVVEETQNLAIKTFKVLCCEGMARVDFFLRDNGELVLNEINTIPGFTKISMYPKLWEASGVPFPELIDKLIELAVERFDRDKMLKTNYV